MVDGANMYLYCGNDPVNLVDVWGLCGNDWGEWLQNSNVNWKTFGIGLFGVLGGLGEIAEGYVILSTPGVNVPFGLLGYSLLQGGSGSFVFGAVDIMNSFSGKEPLGLQLFYGTPGIPHIYSPNIKDNVFNPRKKNIDIPYWKNRA